MQKHNRCVFFKSVLEPDTSTLVNQKPAKHQGDFPGSFSPADNQQRFTSSNVHFG